VTLKFLSENMLNVCKQSNYIVWIGQKAKNSSIDSIDTMPTVEAHMVCSSAAIAACYDLLVIDEPCLSVSLMVADVIHVSAR
jgi:hypothetical protein